MAAPRHSRRRHTQTFTDAAAAHAYVDDAWRADRRQGRRPRRRQGRGGGDDARSKRTRRSTRCWPATRSATARPPRGDRRIPHGRGSELHRHGRRRARAAARVVAGPQAASATATRGPIPAAWAPTRPRRWSRPTVHARIMREIILPRRATAWPRDGMPYTGFLYAGVMIDADGKPRALEFNCRLGDPETQPILMRLKIRPRRPAASTPSTARSTGSRRNGTGARRWAWCSPRRAIPTTPRKGDAITGLTRIARRAARCSTRAPRCDGDDVVTAGGRVLCVTALGETVRQAQRSRVRRRGRHTLRRHAISHRHRPSRAGAAQG